MRKARIVLCWIVSGVLWAGVLPAWAANNLAFDACEQRYLDAYTLVRQAFEDKTQGRFSVALQKFQTARNYLLEIEDRDPQWHTDTVRYLRSDCDKQIQAMQNVRGQAGVQSEKRVRNLTEEMLYTIQKSRRIQSGVSEEPRRGEPAVESRLPMLSEAMKRPSARREEPALLTTRRVEAPRPDRFAAEKVEALEAGFMSQKKETEQWKLQYSILEEKAKEEIRSLSSEFAKEKADLESQIQQTNKTVETLKASEQKAGEKIQALEGEKKKQEEMIQSLKGEIEKNQQAARSIQEEKSGAEEKIQQSAQRISELERALLEAQSIRSKAEEEAKIREGQIAIQIQEAEARMKEVVTAQWTQKEQQLEADWKAQVAQLKAEQKRLIEENTQKLARSDEEIKKLEQKLVTLVKDEAAAEEQSQKLIQEKDKLAKNIQELTGQLEEIKTQSAKQIAEKEEAVKKALLGNEEIQKLKEKIESLQAQSKKDKEALTKASQARQTAEKNLTEVEKTLGDLEETNQKLREEKTYFLEQERKFTEEKQEWQLKLDQWQKQLAKAEEDLNRLQYESAQKEGIIRNIQSQSEVKMAQIKSENEKTVMQLLESFKQEKGKWQSETAKLEAQIEAQKKGAPAASELESLNNKSAKLEAENRSLLSEKETFNQRIRALEAQKISDEGDARKRAELERLLASSENEKKDLYQEVNRLGDEVATLRVQLRQMESIPAPAPVVKKEEIESKKETLSAKKMDEILQQIREKIQSGKNTEVLELLDKNLALYPEEDRLYFYKGLIYSRMNDFQNAKAAYEKAIAFNPQMDKAYNNLGNLLSKQGKYGEAIANLKKATQINPNLSEAYNNMGIVYTNLGQFDEAIKAFIRATEISPKLAVAYYNLGQIYFQDKKLDAARASFNKVLTLEPNHAEAKRYLAILNSGAPAQSPRTGGEKIEVVQDSEVK